MKIYDRDRSINEKCFASDNKKGAEVEQKIAFFCTEKIKGLLEAGVMHKDTKCIMHKGVDFCDFKPRFWNLN